MSDLPHRYLSRAQLLAPSELPCEGWECTGCDAFGFSSLEDNARFHAAKTGHTVRQVMLILEDGIQLTDPDRLVEYLADYAHDAWSGWMKYLFEKTTSNSYLGDGGGTTETIPAQLVDRWRRQLSTQYKDLPADEKKSDRDEAKKMLDIIRRAGFDLVPRHLVGQAALDMLGLEIKVRGEMPPVNRELGMAIGNIQSIARSELSPVDPATGQMVFCNDRRDFQMNSTTERMLVEFLKPYVTGPRECEFNGSVEGPCPIEAGAHRASLHYSLNGHLLVDCRICGDHQITNDVINGGDYPAEG